MLYENERKQIVEACLEMARKGLVVGTAGNVSIRVGEHVVISPSAVPYEEMTPADVAVVDRAGMQIEGNFRPSSECKLHLSVYANTDAGAITHNHAPASTALGLVVEDEIPVSHYYSMLFGGPIRVAGYSLFGGKKLADEVTAALEGRTAALMSNHGAITIGKSLSQALELLPYLEYVCEIHLRALATGLPVKILSEDEMAEAGAGVAGYGKKEN